MYQYVPNNIHFRCITSKCIEKFKNVQSGLLINVLKNNICEFSETSKELLNLNFDLWFKWLLNIEQLIINDKKADTKYIASTIKIYCEERKATLLYNLEEFDPNIIKIWLKVNELTFDFFYDYIIELKTNNIDEFFLDITNILIMLLNNVLFEIHEIDTLINKSSDEYFVSYSDLCILYNKFYNHHQCLLVDRAVIYKETFGITKFVIKNYTEPQLSVHPEIYELLKLNEIEITREC